MEIYQLKLAKVEHVGTISIFFCFSGSCLWERTLCLGTLLE